MAPHLIPVIILAVVLGLWAIVKLLARRRRAGGMRSIAILRRSPLSLTDARVNAIVERALGNTPEVTFIQMPARDDGATMHAFVRDGRAYGIIGVPRPYVSADAHDDIRASITDPDAARATTEHRAWVSVDFMRGDADLAEINRVICRVIAELIDEEAMLLWDVRHGRLSKIDELTKQTLLGPAPMLVFGTHDIDDPTVTARGGDEALAAARAEAQRRWPEFVAAWHARTPEQHCAVKAQFRDGKRVEHLWIQVHGIDDDSVTGVLGNDPQHVRNLKPDQQVTIPLADIEDWLIAEKGASMLGGFSVNALLSKKLG